jgi:hypothetical protein
VRSDFQSVWKRFWSWSERHPGGEFLFRGQAGDTPLVPKVGRPGYASNASKERAMLQAFERGAFPFLKDKLDSFELLALAQHHGAPTRLLDWSTTPLVASWFAVSSFPEEDDARLYALDLNRSDLRRMFELKENGPTGTPESSAEGSEPDAFTLPTGVWLLETAQVSSRITTQRGIFTLHTNPTERLSVPKKDEFVIPKDVRKEFHKRLIDLGIDAALIYPDLDGLCRRLDWLMKFEKPLTAFGE